MSVLKKISLCILLGLGLLLVYTQSFFTIHQLKQLSVQLLLGA
jgi:hypothetical protein